MKSPTDVSVVLAVLIMTGACAESETEDQAAPGTSAMMMDTMPGMGQSQMMDGQHGPARDANHEFLRMMSNHHEGLVLIATQAMDKGSAEQTKSDAHELHTKQAAERDTMLAMIARDYQERHQPMVMHKNQAQADSLSAHSGPTYDGTFYRLVIDHHRDGIRMIDQFLPRLSKPELTRMAEKMKSDQQKEIVEFQRKAGN